MESYLQLIPVEIFEYILDDIDSFDITDFQDVLDSLDIILNWEILFSNKYNKIYKMIKSVLLHDVTLKKFVDWKIFYLDIRMTDIKNRLEYIDQLGEQDIIDLSTSTLTVIGYAVIHYNFSSCYHMKNYFRIAKIRSYLLPIILFNILYDGLEELNINENEITDFIEDGHLNQEFVYSSEYFYGISSDIKVGLVFLLSFDPKFKIDTDDIKHLKSNYDRYIYDTKRNYESPFDQHYYFMLEYLEKKYM